MHVTVAIVTVLLSLSLIPGQGGGGESPPQSIPGNSRGIVGLL